MNTSDTSNTPVLNPFTLAFRDDNIEKEFLLYYFDESLPSLRIGLIAGLLTFGAAGAFLYWMAGELDFTSTSIFFFIIPILSVFGAITYIPNLKNFTHLHMFLVFFGLLFAGLSTSYLITKVPIGNAIFGGYGFITMFLVFNYLLLRLRFIYALISGTAISFLFFYFIYPINKESVYLEVFNFDHFWNHPDITSSGLFSIQVAMILMVNFSSSIACYVLEKNVRISFSRLKEINYQKLIIEQERNKSEELLLNILPAPIAEKLKESNKTIADSFQDVTVLFSDIVGFTTISNKYPAEAIVDLLNQLFSLFDSIMKVRGIEKIKTIGDAYMAVAGVPIHRYDHLEIMADAALAMLSAVNSINLPNGEPITVRIGIHSGPAVAGVIGTHKFAYDLWGDTVNTASRMESHGLAGKIHVSERVHEVLGDKYAWEYRGEIDIKGKDKMRTWFLLYKIQGSYE